MSTGWRQMGKSRQLAALFLVVAGPPAVALIWFGSQLLQDDNSFWTQREIALRRATAAAVTLSLEKSLAEAERMNDDAPPEGIVRYTFESDGIRAYPTNRILWLPESPKRSAASQAAFEPAEQLEFRGAPDQALTSYQELARSPSAAVRAGALLRIARVHRRASQWDAALAAYRELAVLRTETIDGQPADLVARRAACAILEETIRTTALRHEVAALERDLFTGRWMLDRPAWEVAFEEIGRWNGQVPERSAEREAFSEIGSWLWNEWRTNPETRVAGTRRRIVVSKHTVLWRAEHPSVVAIVVSPTGLRPWIDKAIRSSGSTDALTLTSASSAVLAGPEPTGTAGTIQLTVSETGLPWTLVIGPGNWPVAAQQIATRRRLLSFGLAALVLLLAGSSYVLWRVIQRELVIARLQTDFVATVSHEFRTPLTSLAHITELLEENDEMPRDRRHSFYVALTRSTQRLHRLVESLLDFSRMESGRKPYDMKVIDVGELTTGVVADFRKEIETRGFAVELNVEQPAPFPVRADAPSLGNALWNLLDNAVKYSPERQTVRVSVNRHPSGVAIAVQDDGIGIPRSERSEIFRRFVRGEQAAKLGIKGTGLGLAMVSHIVQAHGGTIELESEEGGGSTFRLVLPQRS